MAARPCELNADRLRSEAEDIASIRGMCWYRKTATAQADIVRDRGWKEKSRQRRSAAAERAFLNGPEVANPRAA